MKHSKSSLPGPNHSLCAALLAATVLACPAAQAEPANSANPADFATPPNAWAFKLTPQVIYGSYKKAPIRDSVSSIGAFAAAQYLEKGGVSIGATHTDLRRLLRLPVLRQDNYFLSGHVNYAPASLPGKLTFRMDAHHATNSDITNETNGVRVIAPQLSFIDSGKTRYFDLGYARSRYGDSNIGYGSLSVNQWTPTLGFGLNNGSDWVQLRVYDIRVSNPARAQNLSGTDALEGKWTHYLAPGNGMPEQIQIGALVGKRIYAVDGDSAGLYNLADVQRGGISAGAQWKIAPHAKLLVTGGYDRYETPSWWGGSTIYSKSYIYSAISAQW